MSVVMLKLAGEFPGIIKCGGVYLRQGGPAQRRLGGRKSRIRSVFPG